MSAAMLTVFWLSVAALGFAWFGYAACLAVLARIFRRPVKRDASQMSVTLIIPVHNGGELIDRKIRNVRGLDYPRELLEVIVADDCSTDHSAEGVLRQAQNAQSAHDGLRVIRLERRLGKAAALNAGLEVATGEIIGFTDVAAMLRSDSLAVAVERFADPMVGCVSSEDEVVSSGGIGGSEGIYTRIDTMIRRYESAICSATGMSGSFYLVRRELCPAFPLDVATDMYSALYCVSKGLRAVVEDRSKVELTAQPDPSREFERKVRTMVTGLRALRRFRGLLSPARGLIALFLWSHKALRYMTPVFALSALASSAYLAAGGGLYWWLLWAELVALCVGISQIGIHANAQAHEGAQDDGGNIDMVATAMGFACVSIGAAAVGWYRYFKGERYETWQPTERNRP